LGLFSLFRPLPEGESSRIDINFESAERRQIPAEKAGNADHFEDSCFFEKSLASWFDSPWIVV
jgi:hypothetical protein